MTTKFEDNESTTLQEKRVILTHQGLVQLTRCEGLRLSQTIEKIKSAGGSDRPLKTSTGHPDRKIMHRVQETVL